MQNPSEDERRLLEFIARQGLASSREIQAFMGKSQSAVSRLLLGLTQDIARIGHARSTQYSILNRIHGLHHEQALYCTDLQGIARQIGTLAFLAGGRIHVQTKTFAATTTGVPWYLDPWRLDGFLGRLQAQRLSSQGLDTNPDRWSTEDILYSALQIGNHPGALELGDLSTSDPLPVLPAGPALDAALDHLATDVAKGLPAGSSAGGEQPKFLARLAGTDTQQVLVKFSPPLGTPFGDGWRDLLRMETVASQVLHVHGIPCARNHFHTTATRAYLISERFDRAGDRGRRHVVAIGAVHRGLLQDRYTHWGDTARALARIDRLEETDAILIQSVLHFGRLIGNTDMHAGNLSFFVEPDTIKSGLLHPCPVYDMLPMIWKPNPTLGTTFGYAPFSVDERALGSPAAPIARAFWDQVARDDEFGQPLRTVARAMAERCTPHA